MKTLLSVAALFVLFIPSGRCQDFDYSFSETYQVTSPAYLKIGTSDGNVTVKPGTGNEIKVYYIARKNGKLLKIDRQELEKEVTVQVNHTGNSLEITVTHDWKNSFWNNNQIDVGFNIVVPVATACTLHTSDGNITLEGLTSEQECKTSDGNVSISSIRGRTTGITSDGNVSLEDIDGDVNVHTSDGNISLGHIKGNVQSGTSDGNISLNVITGDVQSVTSDGSIKLNQVTGSASARTSDGHITFQDFSGSLTAVTSDGNITGNVVSLKDKLSVRTSGGNIDLTLPDHLGLDLNIHGESINVPLVNFTGKSEEKSIQGQINGGGIQVIVEASDGNVNLAYR